MPTGFRFYDLRHTGHTLSTRSGATLKDTMVRAGQSSEKAAMIYQHSDLTRQGEVAAGLDRMVREQRKKAAEKPQRGHVVQTWCKTPELVWTTQRPGSGIMSLTWA